MGKDMDLNFEIFMIVLLVLSIVVVGNFLRDGESNYLEGALLVVSVIQYEWSSLSNKTGIFYKY
jgi:Ca2+/H+ antiporter